jgi:uroporphyrinogen-III synthase
VLVLPEPVTATTDATGAPTGRPATRRPCDLAKRGVLVTRPATQADGLCRLIERAGGRALRFPTVEIRPPAAPEYGRDLLRERWDLIVFISRNAVEGALALAADAFGAEGPQLAAVGRATARAMQASGLGPTLVPAAGFDSEALLALPALTDVAGRRVLIVRGEGGRALLGGTLAKRGAEVHYAEVYRRAPPTLDAASLLPEWHASLHLLTATSDEVLDNLLSLVPDAEHAWLKSLPLAVMSERNAATARARGFAQVAAAPQAGDDGMLAALCALLSAPPPVR